MAKVTLDAGACGFNVVIKAMKTGHHRFRVELVSPCEMVKNLNEELKGKEFGSEVFTTMQKSEIYRICSKYIKHISCPLPAAILKAIEVEGGLAVPRDVTMKIRE
jgi:hypothetical protein